MKFTMKILALSFGVLMLVNIAYAESPREQLKQMVEQLQKSPNDNALRAKIIALALTLNPKPATPDAVTMAEGAAEYAFKNAKTNSDYSDAAKQYEKALLLMPWLADDNFNCGVAHEKAGENIEAIRSFNFYLLAAPHANDAQAIKKRIGGLQYAEQKQISDGAAKTAADAANIQAAVNSRKNAFIKSIQGDWGDGNPSFPTNISISSFENGNANITFHSSGQNFAVSDINITESTLRFTVDDVENGNPETLNHYSLSLNGNDRLTGSETISFTESGKALIRQSGRAPPADGQTLDCSFRRQ